MRVAVRRVRCSQADLAARGGGYDELARRCFHRAPNVDVWLMEYDDRSGGFERLADLPDDKVAALNLVSTKRATLEDFAALRASVAEASSSHPLEQLAVSTQCGFDSGTNAPLDLAGQEAKLTLVAEVAHETWA